MVKYCPVCNKEVDMSYSICPYCNYKFYNTNIDLEKSTTTISGSTFDANTSTASSPSFNELSDSYENENEVKPKRILLESNEFLNEKRLSNYVRWGYLKTEDEDKFSFTDLGKKIYKKNRKAKLKDESQNGN